MNQPLELFPFPDDSAGEWEQFKVSAVATRNTNSVRVEFLLAGNLSEIQIPRTNSGGDRSHDLWKTTCFEFFIREPDAQTYWESNLSPSGDWNFYRFSGYREGMCEEARIAILLSQTERADRLLKLHCELPLQPLKLTSASLELSLTTVVKKQSGSIGYWAAKHACSQPDFHHPQSFIIKI
ncbi:MAG: DOMON-like domain-containing protein [Cyanobacteria bacterium P01_F01_bin.42]